jgi:hypothetical protein
MRTIRSRGALGVAALVCALWAPAVASAAEKPVARSGGAANITPTSVVLNGGVNPNGAETTYFFQYGTTVIYGALTPSTSAGKGTQGVHVAAAVGALAPATTYHYRIVAQNSKGLTRGRDRTFRTRRQPLGVTLGATPNPVPVSGATTLGGSLTGTGNAGRQVALQANPWPYTQGFLAAANAQVTGAAGEFAFNVLGVPVNTQYRVQMASRPDVVSPLVVVGTTVKVTRRVRVNRGLRAGRIRFRGRLTPAVDGQQVLIQKLRKGIWVNRGQTTARHGGAGFSRYSKRVRVRRGGRFRVVVNDITGQHSASPSRSVRVHHVRG